jgi:cytidylate kinase
MRKLRIKSEELMENEIHTIVAISRAMASGGSYIGCLLAEKINFKYVDREILRQAAINLGTDERWLENYEEKSSAGILSTILRGCAFGSPEAGYIPPFPVPVYDKDLFKLQSSIINQIADKHNAVIIGRGGFHVLRERPKVVKVFIHAPMEFRVKRFMRLQNISEQKARSILHDSDQKRAKFIQDMVGVNWTDLQNYHLCIDSSIIDFNLSVDLIARVVRELSVPQ